MIHLDNIPLGQGSSPGMTTMEQMTPTDQVITQKLAALATVGLRLYSLDQLSSSDQRQYAEQISAAIAAHPEHRMLPKTPEQILAKDMLVVVDESLNETKLAACGGTDPPFMGQTEIGTLFTFSEEARSYRKLGFATLITAILTARAHTQGLNPVAFCNENSAPIFAKLGYTQVYFADKISAPNVSRCQDQCLTYQMAQGKIDRAQLAERIAATDDPIEQFYLEKQLAKLQAGATVLKCCDTIMMLPVGNKINYE